MEIIRITPDRERAKSILKMTELIEKRIGLQDPDSMAALIIADYYEIIKGLITAIMLIDGYKTLSHKELVNYLRSNYSEFSAHEIELIDRLRALRNRITYEGMFVDPSYLRRNEGFWKEIISKLRGIIERRLNLSNP